MSKFSNEEITKVVSLDPALLDEVRGNTFPKEELTVKIPRTLIRVDDAKGDVIPAPPIDGHALCREGAKALVELREAKATIAGLEAYVAKLEADNALLTEYAVLPRAV